MKRKLLLAALCVVGAIGGGNFLKAQTDVTSQYLTNEGWTEVTELPSADELTNFYYVLVATEKDLMVAQEQNYEQESQLTLVYRNFLNPFTWKRVVWSIEYDDTHLYSLRNLKNSTYLMQSRKDATWRVQFAWEQSQSEWTQWQFAYADGSWTIQNKLSSDNGGGDSYYLGAWNSQKWVDGEVLAGNKSGNDVGHFKIYQIARDTYNAKTKQNATDVTSLITNPSFDNGGTFTATRANAVGTTIPGWTITGGNYQYYSVAYSGQGNSVRDNNSGFGKTVRGAEGKQYIGTRLTWQPSETSMAQTLSNLPEGEYTLSVACKGATPSSTAPSLTMKATPVTGSIGGVKKTFPTGKTRNNTAYTFEDNYGDWTRLSYVFNVTSAGNVELNLAMNNNTTGGNNNGNDEVVIDDLNLTYKNYTASLESALDRAALLYARTSDSDLSTAIENAQSVLDNVDNTTNYQTTINSAVTVLRSVINTTYAKVEFASGEDITFLLENASFESGEALPANVTTSFNNINSTDVYVKMQPLEGWTIGSAEENITAGVFEYGMDYGISGYTANNIETPVTGHSNAVLMLAGWGAKTQYTQDVTLPAGRYSITVPVYNKGGATAFSKNLIGFIEKGGTEHLATTKNYSVGSWITSTIEFDLNTETDGYMSVGYTSVSGQGSGNMPRLYVDGFTITYTDAANAYDQTKTAATETLGLEIYANVVGTERIDLQTLLNADVSEYTVAQYFTAIDNINAAVATFTAAKTNYDALVAEIAKAKALGIDATTADGYAATSSSTAATALTSTQNLKVAEYNYVTSTYQYGVDLGTWTTTGDETADNKSEHWDGTTTSTYKEQLNSWGTPKKGYAADSWTIGFSQTLNLPAGNYVFKVAGRQSSGACTMALNVKKGDEVLGTVNDFPKSNTGKGIDTNGATNFGDGTYANDNNGRGWEWRYVKFELSETADVTVSIDAQASAANQWISFANYTVQTDNDANISLIAYNIALNDAQTAKANTDYANVTGEELTALNAAIAVDETLDKTNKSAIEAAATTLKETTAAFTAAKDSYDKLVIAKAQFNDADYTQELYPYATDEKFAAIATANAMEEGNATKNAAKATAMIAAYRTFVESNAKAEKSATAVDKTSVIENADAQQGDENAITVGQAFGWTKGTGIERKNNEEFIDATGSGGSNYFNYWNGSNAWTKKITQKVNIPAGKYILTATTRASSTLTKFNLIAGDASAEMKRINADVNTGTFNRGWNDNYVVFTVEKAGQVEIGIDAAGPSNTWMSFDRFRLVQISQEITTTSSANLEGYKTFYNADVNYEVDENTTIYVAEAPSAGATYVKINAVEGKIVPKNTPVILKTSDTENYTITLTPTEETATISDSDNALKVASAAGAVENAYILGYLDQEGEGLGFYRYEPSLDKGDIYLVVPATTAANVRLGIIADGEATGIESVNAEAGKANDAIYNMAGQRVGNGYKGIVIKNGKKILVK